MVSISFSWVSESSTGGMFVGTIRLRLSNGVTWKGVRGAFEDVQELRTVALADEVATKVAEKISRRVKEDVGRQLRAFFNEHRRNVTRSMRQKSLIQSAFQQQADMLRDDHSDEVESNP